MQQIKEFILMITPFGLLSAVAWSVNVDTKGTLMYWVGFGLFAITLILAGYGLVKLDDYFEGK